MLLLGLHWVFVAPQGQFPLESYKLQGSCSREKSLHPEHAPPTPDTLLGATSQEESGVKSETESETGGKKGALMFVFVSHYPDLY